jgi:hypothetical protein
MTYLIEQRESFTNCTAEEAVELFRQNKADWVRTQKILNKLLEV